MADDCSDCAPSEGTSIPTGLDRGPFITPPLSLMSWPFMQSAYIIERIPEPTHFRYEDEAAWSWPVAIRVQDYTVL
jgi:hypothetical protein